MHPEHCEKCHKKIGEDGDWVKEGVVSVYLCVDCQPASRDDEEVARQIANDCATFEHQDECERRIKATLAANRNALIEAVKAQWDERLTVPVECLVDSKRQAFVAGARAMYDSIITAIEGE